MARTKTTRTVATPEEKTHHRQVLEALSGLISGMFVAILAGTVVSTSLPVIVADLGGDQTAYTWIVVSTLLATTVSTPIWGKLADLVDRKLLIQIALVIFVLGSALAGFSQNSETLIAFRVIQGLGAGGLTALVQVAIADIISPRERGRYMGLIGAVMAVATVGGPLLGGVVTDGLGWRWNFYIALPIAVAALILIQRTLHLPKRSGKVTIDYLGAGLIASGVSLLLIWVSLGGKQFEWNSLTSWIMIIGTVVLLAAAVTVELKVKEPIIPMELFRNRTFVLAVIASLSVGVAMFGTSVFLSQYFQLARGNTPTESGLLTLPMVLGLFIASTVVGTIISRTGHWKRWMVTGSILLATGLGLMGTLRYDTPYGLMSVFMALMGLGIGMTMQNLVLVTQNSLKASQLGAGSSTVTFFRSLGGTIGVAALGTVLGARVGDLIEEKLAALGIPAGAVGDSGTAIPDLSTLPEPVRIAVESAYGEAVGFVFLIAAPLALVTIVAIALLPNIPLGSKNAVQQLQEERGSLLAEVSANDIGSTTTATGSVRTIDRT
ncbi:MAG: MDR family MFS transporter [Naasia sp.]